MDNKAKEGAYLAIDFMESLDKSRYLAFVIDILNDITSGAIIDLSSVNEVYNLVSTRLEANKSPNSGGCASSYSTIHTRKKDKSSGRMLKVITTRTKMERNLGATATKMMAKQIKNKMTTVALTVVAVKE